MGNMKLIKSRVGSTLYRLESYIRKDIDILEELEEDLLMYNCVNSEKSNQINLNRYKDIATQNIISWQNIKGDNFLVK